MACSTSLAILLFTFTCGLYGALGSHSWSNYHWGSDASGGLRMVVVSSLDGAWDGRLKSAVKSWSEAAPFQQGAISVEEGDKAPRARKACRAEEGKVHVCNADWGQSGWLGLSAVFSDPDGHITACVARINEGYGFPTDVSRRQVMCQEIGHCWGLGHQSTSGEDLNTCMDYAAAHDNARPDDHDMEQLEAIYNHQDAPATASSRRLLRSSSSRKLMLRGLAAPSAAAAPGNPGGAGAAAAYSLADEDLVDLGTLVEETESELYWERVLPDGTRMTAHALKASPAAAQQQQQVEAAAKAPAPGSAGEAAGGGSPPAGEQQGRPKMVLELARRA